VLVILFGLLFAPMMIGMDMATRGRSQVRMQDAARLAIEQIHRELSQAMYVYPTPVIVLSTGNIPDYSQVVFVPPARDQNGVLLQPLRPRMTGASNNQILATRFCVQLLNSAQEHSVTNPFVLYRQDGTYVQNPTTNVWTFTVQSSNAMTPKDNCDIVPSMTVYAQDPVQTWPGYYYPTDPSVSPADLHYLFPGIQFTPQRVVGEYLTPNDDGYLYTAKYGNWLGQFGNGIAPLPATALLESALDPRIIVYRSLASAGNALTCYLDSYTTGRVMPVTWDSTAGTVRVGQYENRRATVNSVGTDPGLGIYSVAMTNTDVSASPTTATDIFAINPPTPTMTGDARMPVAYRINPEAGGGNPAKIVPSSVRVWVTAVYAGTNGISQTIEYTPTTDTDQAEMGVTQFAVVMDPNNRSAEVRFARYQPPSPDQYGAAGVLSGFWIDIQYYARTNFDPTSNVDDTIRADYWTRDIVNVTLQLQQYTDFEPDTTNPDAQVIPTNEHPAKIELRDQISVQNMGR
jgi:hypothetical protein